MRNACDSKVVLESKIRKRLNIPKNVCKTLNSKCTETLGKVSY